MDFTPFYSWTSAGLQSTWYYYQEIVDFVSPTVNFIYDNWLTNPIFYWLLLALIILWLFTFWDSE